MRLGVSAATLVCAIALPILMVGLFANDSALASSADYGLTADIGLTNIGLAENDSVIAEPVHDERSIPVHVINQEYIKKDVIPHDEEDAIRTAANILSDKEIEAKTAEAKAAAEEAVAEAKAAIAKAESEAKSAEEAAAVAKAAEEAAAKAKATAAKEPEIYTDANGNRYKKATYIVTAYTLSYASCGKYPDDPAYGITASGKYVKPHYTLSAPKSIPFGTKIRIPAYEKFYGLGHSVLVVQDRGASITSGKLDIYFESERDAKNWGRRKIEVHIYI